MYYRLELRKSRVEETHRARFEERTRGFHAFSRRSSLPTHGPEVSHPNLSSFYVGFIIRA